MLSQDSLSELSFSMQLDQANSVIATMVFNQVSRLKQLRTLKISAISAVRKTNIEILNNSLSKESPIEELEVNFVHEPD
jgi:hypothetical protein